MKKIQEYLGTCLKRNNTLLSCVPFVDAWVLRPVNPSNFAALSAKALQASWPWNRCGGRFDGSVTQDSRVVRVVYIKYFSMYQQSEHSSDSEDSLLSLPIGCQVLCKLEKFFYGGAKSVVRRALIAFPESYVACVECRCQTVSNDVIFADFFSWKLLGCVQFTAAFRKYHNNTKLQYIHIYILIFCGKEQTCYSRLPRVLRRQAVSHRCSQRRLTSVSCEMSFEHGNRCRCGWGAEEPFDAWRVRNCWKESVKVRKVRCDSCLQWWLQLHPWDLNC